MGLCGAAAMHLKGEGVAEKNISKAVDLYGEAAALGSVKALNGLGYIYFYGEALPKNETKAFHYFLAASDAGLDGDSFTNAAHCLANGIGDNHIPSPYSPLFPSCLFYRSLPLLFPSHLSHPSNAPLSLSLLPPIAPISPQV